LAAVVGLRPRLLGKARAVVNFLAVFTFVALWHDINLKLLIWGWLVTLFILPEVLAGFLSEEEMAE
jgi:D-alanyl-lipoteichoic acid acyltransferase DltB (MBOAT superfamily)